MPAATSAAEAWFLVAVLGVALVALLAARWRAQRRRSADDGQHAQQARRLKQQLDLVLSTSADVYWELDVRTGILSRQGIQRIAGASAPNDIPLARWREESVHPDDVERLRRLVERHVNGESEVFESEHRIRAEDGHWRWVRARGRVIDRDAAGKPVRMAGITRDIQELRRAERETRVAYEVFRSMSEAVSVIDLDFTFTAVNPAFSRITGYSEADVLGQPSSMLDLSQHSAEFYQRVRGIVVRSGHWSGEMWQRRKDGGEFLSWIELSEVTDASQQRTHFVAVVNDITQKKRAEQELRYLANYDTLTNLPNRTLLNERLSRAIVRARRQDSRLALLFLDLDHFKDVNDAHGHGVGDQVLVHFARVLRQALRPQDLVGRIGGEEFLLALPNTEPQGVHQVLRRLRGILTAQPPVAALPQLRTTFSSGVAHALPDDNVHTLWTRADRALYRAKAAGRGVDLDDDTVTGFAV